MAQEAGVSKLVLSRVGPRLGQQGPMFKASADVAESHDGEMVFAEELMRVPDGGPQRTLRVKEAVEHCPL